MRCTALLLVLSFAAETASAKDYDDFSFGLRLQAALSRFSRYPDVAGTAGASAAAIWGSAANPAGSAWLDLGGLSPQYSRIDFDAGTTADVVSVSYAWSTKWGVFQPSIAYIDTNHATTRQGLGFHYETRFFELQWAKKTSDDTAWGANFNLAFSDLEFDAGPAPAVRSESETYGFRFGWLHQPLKPLWVGVVFDYAFAPSRTTEFDVITGVGDIRTKDTAHQFLLRPGVHWEYRERSRLYLDYQFAVFTDDTGTLREHRLFAGVDHMVFEPLAVRAGTLVDDFGKVAWSVGVGIFPSERVFIDIAYQQDMFPEVEREFGDAQVFAISVSVSF